MVLIVFHSLRNQFNKIMEHFLWVTIDGINYRTAQSKHIIKPFSMILKDFEQIIEIGTFTGAFTYWLSENKLESCEITSYDINSYNLLINSIKDTKLQISDCFEPETISEIKSLINRPKRTLLLCDGGDKETEFKLFSRFLKSGDVVMLHDYSETSEEYEKIKKELDWPTVSESHYKNLERYLPELNLKPYLYDTFKQVLWGSFIKC